MFATALAAELREQFGEDNIFFDSRSIEVCSRWPRKIEEGLFKAKVIVALLSDNWSGKQEDGTRRIDGKIDIFRDELELGLKREILMPVYIDRNPLIESELPLQLKSMLEVQGVNGVREEYFSEDIHRVVEQIRLRTGLTVGRAARVDSWVPGKKSSLIGRSKDVGAIVNLFTGENAECRWVTISAPPCLGKTSLGKEVARVVMTNTSWMVQWIDVTNVTTASGLASEVAARFKVDSSQMKGEDSEIQIRIGDTLAAQGELLLVLDNFEQLSDVVKETLVVWLDRASGLRILLTSRKHRDLSRRGQYLYQLKPLEHVSLEYCDSRSCSEIMAEPAFVLFRERAESSLGGGFDFDDFNEDKIRVAGRIVARCGGFPAPIELAAMGLGSGLLYLEKQLDKKAFVDGDGDIEEERQLLHITLESLLQTNLSKDERIVFALLSRFVGGFSFDSFNTIFRFFDLDECELWDKLDRLNLMQAYRGPTKDESMRSLYLPIREYLQGGWEVEIEKNTESEFLDRYRDYYIGLSKRMNKSVRSKRRVKALRELANIRENVLACVLNDIENKKADLASESVLSISDYFLFQGSSQVYLKLLDTVLEFRGELNNITLSRLYRARAKVYWNLGVFKRADVDFQEAIDLVADLGVHIERAEALRESLKMGSRLHEQRYEVSKQVKSLLLELGDPRADLSMGAFSLAWMGRYEEAFDEYENSYEVAKAIGDPHETAKMLNYWGLGLWKYGAPQDALGKFEESLVLFEELEDRNYEGGILTNIGLAKTDLNLFSEAEEAFASGSQILKSLGNLAWLSVNLTGRARLILRKGDPEGALKFIVKNRSAIMKSGYEENETLLNIIEGISLSRIGDYEKACVPLDIAIAWLRSENLISSTRFFTAMVAKAFCHLELKQSSLAKSSVIEAIDIAKKSGLLTRKTASYISESIENAKRISQQLKRTIEV